MQQYKSNTNKAQNIREDFINFFRQNEHKLLAPSKIYNNDPTLLFVNAGMNQLKEEFLKTVNPNEEKEEKFRRLCNSQICIRAGGKHNDLDDVGLDSYHLTSFEMLGNWSINSYQKEEAIRLAFTYLTVNLGLDKSRMYVTYFQGSESENLDPDTESRDIWMKYMPESRIVKGNFKDNFWMMSETGPCGQSSEIHYDISEQDRFVPELVNNDDPTLIEIWNIVFIQYNRRKNTTSKVNSTVDIIVDTTVDTIVDTTVDTIVNSIIDSTVDTTVDTKVDTHVDTTVDTIVNIVTDKMYVYDKLDRFFVDTGLGLERLCMVLQKKESIYKTDVFHFLMGYAQAISNCEYTYSDCYDQNSPQYNIDCAYRIFCDHFRTLVIALFDGVVFDCTGRGYVLRKIFRRLMTYYYLYLNNNVIEQVMNRPIILGIITDILNYHLKKNHDNVSIRDKLISEEKLFYGTLQNIKRNMIDVLKTNEIDGSFDKVVCMNDPKNKKNIQNIYQNLDKNLDKVFDEKNIRNAEKMYDRLVKNGVPPLLLKHCKLLTIKPFK